MTASREPWWENTHNAALVIVALIMASMILGFIADWTGYLRTSPHQPADDGQLEEPAQPRPAGS